MENKQKINFNRLHLKLIIINVIYSKYKIYVDGTKCQIFSKDDTH